MKRHAVSLDRARCRDNYRLISPNQPHSNSKYKSPLLVVKRIYLYKSSNRLSVFMIVNIRFIPNLYFPPSVTSSRSVGGHSLGLLHMGQSGSNISIETYFGLFHSLHVPVSNLLLHLRVTYVLILTTLEQCLQSHVSRVCSHISNYLLTILMA
jgi:hypothetical protein